MKKTAFILLFALMILSILPIFAFAANETEGSTVLTYIKNEPPTTEPDPPPSPSTQPTTYEINIPATVSLNTEQEIRFTANYVNVDDVDNRAVVVSLIGTNFDYDVLWLSNDSSDRIGVSFYLLRPSDTPLKLYFPQPSSSYPVAFFTDGNTAPSVYGTLRVIPSEEDIDAVRPGTYSGTVQFKISLGYY